MQQEPGFLREVHIGAHSKKWGNYSLFFYDIRKERGHSKFFNEYRMAVLANDYLHRRVTRGAFNQYVWEILRYTAYVRENREARKVKEDQAVGAIGTVALLKKYLEPQMNILDYIAVGKWRGTRLRRGDEMYMVTFGEHADLPLLWFVISYNQEKHYMRLHAWSKSLLAEFMYPVYKNKDCPRGPGIFALSMLINELRIDRIYLHALEYTHDLLVKMLRIDPATKRLRSEEGAVRADALPRLVNPEDEREVRQAAGEDQVMEVTQTMRQAYKMDEGEDDVVGECILCRAPAAQFYMAHLGPEIRFCGSKLCLQ